MIAKLPIRPRLLASRIAAALLSGCFVFAALPPSADASDMEKAKAAFATAREQARVGNFAGALESIAEVERYMKHPTVSLLKARALRRTWHLDRAQKTLDGINPTKLKKALKPILSQEQAKLATVVKTHGQLKVSVRPATAAVSIDGKPFGNVVDRWFPAGKRRIEVTADMHQPAVRQATLMAGQMREIKVVLREAAGTIRLHVPGGLKGAMISLDGTEVDIAAGARAGDVTSIRAGVGAHEVICARGKLRAAHVIKVEYAKTVAVSCEDLAGGGAGRVVLGWGGLATGVALAGYGAWGIASYFSDQSEADDNLAQATAADLKNGLVPRGALDTNKHWGGALYLVSGLAVGTVSYLLFVRSPAPAASDSAWRWSDPTDDAWSSVQSPDFDAVATR